VTSESVGGKVDVWSEEGVGTEIKVTFFAEKPEEENASSKVMAPLKPHASLLRKPTVSLINFEKAHEGVKLLRRAIQTYVTWWDFEIHTGPGYGDIAIVNDDPCIIDLATRQHQINTPFILLSAARGNHKIMALANDHEKIGGFCRILFKPGGPWRLRATLKLALHALQISAGSRPQLHTNGKAYTTDESVYALYADKELRVMANGVLPRRNSEENHRRRRRLPRRHSASVRVSAVELESPWNNLSSESGSSSGSDRGNSPEADPVVATISVGSGGSLLKKSAIGTLGRPERRFRVLIVEDNAILRNLL
jgi:hypothetical protein